MAQNQVRQQSKKARSRAGRPARRRSSRRPGIVFIGICLTLFGILLIYNLYQIQIVDHAVNAEKAAAQHYRTVVEQPKRGHIYDRNGVELAGTTYIHQIGVTPKDVYSITKKMSSDEIAGGIASALNISDDLVVEVLAQKDASYIQIKKDATRDEAQALREFRLLNNIGGIRIDTEARRYYTNGMLASQLIGFCRYDQDQLIGQLGVELQYNDVLTGQPGYTYVETDNYDSKGVLPFSAPTSLRAQNGDNIVLNIDINIQKIAQVELERAIKLYDITSGGQVIVMDPHDGAVLAMASWPFFASEDPTACPEERDPESWNDQESEAIEYLSAEVWRNAAISDAYEPGSTMKSITTAIALEEALLHEQQEVVCKPYQLFNWTISCAKAGGHGSETLEMGFWRSCNPVFAKLASDIGIDRFYTYIRSFGLMHQTGIDLPGEGVGMIHESPTELDMATFSFGESSTVTPIQLATAYSAFANGGKLVRPSVVKSITQSEGELVQNIKPETIRQVISERTATRVKELMKGVVLYGTGSSAYVEGYQLAGKTSTSTDDFGDHTLSFAAIAPSDQPEIVVLVILDKPTDKNLTSKAAAVTCGQIVSQILEYLGTERIYSESDVSTLTALRPVPNVEGLTYKEAMRLLSAQGFIAEAADEAMGEATLVQYQWPSEGTELHSKGLVVLYPVTTPDEPVVRVPDFRGRTIHECLRMAADVSLNIRVDGSCLGLVVQQSPQPSTGQTAEQPGLTEPTDTDETDETEGTETPSDNDVEDETEPDNNEPEYLKPGDWVIVTFEAVEEIIDQTEDGT
jgi:stage V sporulation protein D (sporulation-specific penicillin-binding protein)